MRLLITGICGFVGSALANHLLDAEPGLTIYGLDNLSRRGSELNRSGLRHRGIVLFHGDIRSQSDFESLPPVDWIIDAAANPSVLAGVDGKTNSRQLLEHNLVGTLNMLEFARKCKAGFILLSTSRVYSIRSLTGLPVTVAERSFRLDPGKPLPDGVSPEGVSERLSTASPISLYGSAKLSSEIVALEYGQTFDLPVWIDRCGVLAGAGQFGKSDQGIMAFWINSYLRRRPLSYIGFGGKGYQVRDVLHPRDLASLIRKQMEAPQATGSPRTVNSGGGAQNAISLAQLSDWCAARFGTHPVSGDPSERMFDVPWLVMDSSLARSAWKWEPQTSLETILNEIAEHAQLHPDWLELSA